MARNSGVIYITITDNVYIQVPSKPLTSSNARRLSQTDSESILDLILVNTAMNVTCDELDIFFDADHHSEDIIWSVQFDVDRCNNSCVRI